MSKPLKFSTLDEYIFKYLRYNSYRIQQCVYERNYQLISQEDFAKELAEAIRSDVLTHPDTGKVGISDTPTPKESQDE